MIAVEVAYATPQQQIIIKLSVAEHSTVEAAILQSHILEQYPEIDLTQHKVGIFGKRISLSHLLTNGDRIEIYRPLLIDPKAARRLRDQRLKSDLRP